MRVAGVFGQAERLGNVVGFCASACPVADLSLKALILSDTLPGFAAPTGMLPDAARIEMDHCKKEIGR